MLCTCALRVATTPPRQVPRRTLQPPGPATGCVPLEASVLAPPTSRTSPDHLHGAEGASPELPEAPGSHEGHLPAEVEEGQQLELLRLGSLRGRREPGHHAGQRPVLGLQLRVHLLQGLDLL